MRALATLLLLASACGGAAGPAGAVRFQNRAPVWVVDDRRDVPEKPAERKFFKALYHFDGVFYERLDRALELRPVRRAQSTNALDEVPDSTWFTNRIGQRDVTPEEIEVGPNTTGSPEAHRPWTIKSTKVGGITVGFIIKDARGQKYVLKFDEASIPEMETGADVVLQRLLWACGYNVPEDYVVYFRREDLVLADDAVIKDPMGNETPLTETFLEQQLATIHVDADGRIRGLASQFIPGIPIGGHDRDGTRPDDPNDRIRHELRRELRGLYPIFAWLDQTDVKEDNTLDTWVEDPADSKVHYVVHYLLDFGKGLGTQPYINGRRFVSFEFLVDFKAMAKRLLTLGLLGRPWDHRRPPGILGVGMLDAAFDPGRWKAYMPSYFPFHDVDRFDGFWGAKIVARFGEAHVRAAVEQARFSDPRAVDYVTRLLMERRRKVIAYWFARVAPLDGFAVEADGSGWKVCFDDLALRHGVAGAPATATRYRARVFDAAGAATGGGGDTRADASAHTCVGVTPATGADAYTILELDVERRGQHGGPVLVHLARDAAGAPQIIGIRRE
ncbi:MAG TPA: hypothetical protein VMZ28_16715 [Kofleriaceae bacterium]|nr:hypothetical protein [Kofleriaceae bacterium]